MFLINVLGTVSLTFLGRILYSHYLASITIYDFAYRIGNQDKDVAMCNYHV